MATDGCRPMKYVDVCNGAFYFEGTDDVPVDDFDISTNTRIGHLFIHSNDRRFLFLNHEEQFKACQSQPACKFNIQFYTTPAPVEGRAVILYANKDHKKMVVSCRNEREIYAEEMQDLPNHIPEDGTETGHKAVFYRTFTQISDKYRLESSRYRKKFLAFEPDGDTLSKLVLRPKDEGQVDEFCEISMIRKTE